MASDFENSKCVAMLVDEEFLLKKFLPKYELQLNPIGCYLYETDKHGSPIMGNILFVGDTYTDDGITFSGIEEETFNKLYEQLKRLTWKAGAK